MALGLVIVAVLGLQAAGASSDGRTEPSYTRVRSTERYMIGLVREGYDRSPTFRGLVETIQRSNVTVWVQPGLCAVGRIRSCVVSVSGSAQARYIWIKIDPQHTITSGLIAAIGHELQHVVEIAEHPEVTDASDVVKLYRRIALGRCREGLSEECETARALDTEKAVLTELLPKRQKRPSVTWLQRRQPVDRALSLRVQAPRGVSPLSTRGAAALTRCFVTVARPSDIYAFVSDRPRTASSAPGSN